MRPAPSDSASAATMRASADKAKVLVLLRQAPLVRGHLVDRLVERPAGLPSGGGLQLAGGGPSTAQLLEAGTVGLGVRHQPDRRRRARPFDDTARERDD